MSELPKYIWRATQRAFQYVNIKLVRFFPAFKVTSSLYLLTTYYVPNNAKSPFIYVVKFAAVLEDIWVTAVIKLCFSWWLYNWIPPGNWREVPDTWGHIGIIKEWLPRIFCNPLGYFCVYGLWIA